MPKTQTSRLCLTVSLAALGSPVLADAPRVVTDIPAVHALVAQVMGDLGTPVLLLDHGANPHNFQLRPSQAAALSQADLLFWIGPELTPWLARAMAGVEIKGEAVALLDAEGTFLRDYGDHGAHYHDDDHDHAKKDGHDHAKKDGHDHAAEDDHGHAKADAHGHDHAEAEGHDHGGTDPHAWLDPANAKVWLALVAAELAHRDAANAGAYAANASAAAARIVELDAGIAAILAPVQGRPFVVFHDAYGYFAGHYGLSVAGSIALGDAAAPGAARLRAMHDMLREGNVICAFPEAQHDPRLVQTVVEGTTVRIGGTLDPSGSGLEPGPELYERLLTGMAETIANCLKG